MAETPIKIYGDALSTTSGTTIYTGKTGKTCIIKSIIICNVSGVDTTVNMRLNTGPLYFLLNNKSIKANQTLVIPISDIVISPGETLHMWCANSIVNARITGVEKDGIPSSLGLAQYRVGLGTGTTTIVPAAGNGVSRLVKSIVICNVSSGPQTVTIRFGWSGDNCNLINKYTIAGYDTVLIPFADMFISPSEYIEGWTSTVGNAQVHLVMQEATNA
ncbi:hypothetical protein [Paenibacillus sp. AD87]|uniref:hypothetical protein n=1 Tax=Paenibacillus sp. AD87 TaxID=1528787 RepID=UPI0007E30426|nr:hypothetical protein [Paenibacillus sp. AD87]OAX50575.1 hypothetical protein gpAD87_20460 [Paenibacillus sp. AD87]